MGGYVEENPNLTPLTLNAIKQLSKEVKWVIGSKFALMVVPSKYRLERSQQDYLEVEFSDKVKVWAEKTGLDFIDLVPAFKIKAKEKPLFFEKDIHLNKNGHKVVFEAIKSHYPELFKT